MSVEDAITVLDERGRACPAPIIALGRFAATNPPGSPVRLLADDPAAVTDVAVWCRLRGATLERQESDGASWTFHVRLG